MSDGLSESRHEEAANRKLQLALTSLEDALEEFVDLAFGFPDSLFEEINQRLQKLPIRVMSKMEWGSLKDWRSAAEREIQSLRAANATILAACVHPGCMNKACEAPRLCKYFIDTNSFVEASRLLVEGFLREGKGVTSTAEFHSRDGYILTIRPAPKKKGRSK